MFFFFIRNSSDDNQKQWRYKPNLIYEAINEYNEAVLSDHFDNDTECTKARKNLEKAIVLHLNYFWTQVTIQHFYY